MAYCVSGNITKRKRKEFQRMLLTYSYSYGGAELETFTKHTSKSGQFCSERKADPMEPSITAVLKFLSRDIC